MADRKYFGLVGKFSHQGKDVRLLIPTTYMNRSGQSVAALAGFFRIAPDAILVAHDELDMPLASPSSRPAVDTAGTTGCAISSPSSAIRILSIACGLASAIRGTAAWFPVTCSAAREQELLDTSIDFALGVLPEMLAGDWTRAMQKLHSQKA